MGIAEPMSAKPPSNIKPATVSTACPWAGSHRAKYALAIPAITPSTPAVASIAASKVFHAAVTARGYL